MLDAISEPKGKILTDRREQATVPLSENIQKILRSGEISAPKLFLEMIRLCWGRKAITPTEYVNFQVYRKDLTWAEKRAFVGQERNFKINCKMAPPETTQMRSFLNDKFAFGILCEQLGIPFTNLQAMYSPDRFTGKNRSLRTAEDIEAFLVNDAILPVFGKPVNEQQALGAARIDHVDSETATAHFANGQVVSIREMAEEIIREFPEGYAFQSVVVQNDDVTKHVGQTLATLRLVTVIDEISPRSLYAIWKLPGVNAMADNFWQDGSMMCAVNAETGVVERCVIGSGPDQQIVETHPVTGQEIVGYQIPFFDECKKLAEDAHSIFPINSVLGWDVGITDDGPVLIECNYNPAHEFLQTVTGKPTLSAEMQANFDRVVARNKKMEDGMRARIYAI